MLRRAEANPRVAISELNKDISRLRSDLDNVRTALTARGRAVMHDTTDRVSDTTRSTRRFIRRHPNATTGFSLGILALVGGLVYGLMHWRR